MPDVAEFCPSCGRPVKEGNFFAPVEPAGGAPISREPVVTVPPVAWSDRWVGALVYFTFIPAVVFLFLKQFHGRKFVRFHSFQSIFFWAIVVLMLVLGLLASMFGWLLMWMLMGTLISLALFFTWLLLSIKALQGEWFSLPWLGPFAEQQLER